MRINLIEIIGIIASVIVLISMCCDTTTFKGNFYMRITNFIGAVIFVVYGVFIKSVSILVLNAVLAVVHLYYIHKSIVISKQGLKAFKKRQKEQTEHVKEYIDKNKKKCRL